MRYAGRMTSQSSVPMYVRYALLCSSYVLLYHTWYRSIRNTALATPIHSPEQGNKSRGLSDASVSDESVQSVPEVRRGGVGVQLSIQDVHAMMNEEIGTVARELVGEPSRSLLALAGARSEMDSMTQRVQVSELLVYRMGMARFCQVLNILPSLSYKCDARVCN